MTSLSSSYERVACPHCGHVQSMCLGWRRDFPLTICSKCEGRLADSNRDEILAKVVADYDRRRQHWWGRFLLWLLRKTT
jgi:phage terminase large subunit GpA-like protein